MSKKELLWPVKKVRQAFLDHFAAKEHKVIPTAPVVPIGDPTLLFINSGMAQFKPKFLGTADPSTEFGMMKRAVDSQICIRAGGKHNDLDDVGKDTYHHTLFEMLGNWSFGDFYKTEAIDWAWELLTEVYKLDKSRLYVTYFEGSEKTGVAADEECRAMWRKYVPDERILKGNAKDNFWEMGDTGPCGPCTEIHFDFIGNRDASGLVNKDDPSVIEVWNLVFMQYNRIVKGGPLTPLPSKHVDTGMGLERISSILQNVTSNYDTDLWEPLFEKIQQTTGYPKSYTELLKEPDANTKNTATHNAIVAYRVVADHARTLTVAIADGAAPSNQGRGFVLRRILRRAVRYGVQFLGASHGFFSPLVEVVCSDDVLGCHAEVLTNERTQRRVTTLIRDEEVSFAKTWKNGLKHFEVATGSKYAKANKAIDPEDAFTLHDRYGFPVDLTKLLAEEKSLQVDFEKFKECMQKYQTGGGRVAAARTFLGVDDVNHLQKELSLTKSDDSHKHKWEDLPGCKIVAIFNKQLGKFVDSVSSSSFSSTTTTSSSSSSSSATAASQQQDEADIEPEQIGIVLEKTNFYAEAGGQIFDHGSLTDGEEGEDGSFDVKRVFAFGGYVVHIGDITRGRLRVNDTVSCEVDYERRMMIAINHTMTHQLNHCLRDVLQFGHPDQFTEVHQRGSLVCDDYLRFDFSWNSKLSPEDIEATEKLLNDAISRKLDIYSKEVPIDQARAIKSIRMEFGARYDQLVTVIAIGRPIEEFLKEPESEDNKKFSIELCGGTHIKNLDSAKNAVIISEDPSQQGVRRLVVYTGEAASKSIAEGDAFRSEFEELVKSQTTDYDAKSKSLSVLNKRIGDSQITLVQKIKLRDDIDKAIRDVLAEKKAYSAKLKTAAQDLGKDFASKHSADQKYAVLKLDGLGAERDTVQAAMDSFSAALPAEQQKSGVSVLALAGDAQAGKGMCLAVSAPAHVSAGLSAVEWVKAACGGKGGGKPNAAQGGLSASQVDAGVQGANKYASEKKL